MSVLHLHSYLHPEVTEIFFKGCGSSPTTCPNKAITFRHFNNNGILAEIEGIVIDMTA
jgi:heterodisulfide reductase subunit A-like polyferredoxin